MVFWISLAVLLVALVVGIAYCVLRGLQLYRNAKRASGRITAEMDRISEVTRQIERQSAKAAAASERLNGATAGWRNRAHGSTCSSPRSARRRASSGARSGSSRHLSRRG